jgi:hypothetical protein
MSHRDHQSSTGRTYAKTFAKSPEGDMRKLSLLEDHDIRCWIFGSSSMLPMGVSSGNWPSGLINDVLVQFVDEGRLDHLGLRGRGRSPGRCRRSILTVSRVVAIAAIRWFAILAGAIGLVGGGTAIRGWTHTRWRRVHRIARRLRRGRGSGARHGARCGMNGNRLVDARCRIVGERARTQRFGRRGHHWWQRWIGRARRARRSDKREARSTGGSESTRRPWQRRAAEVMGGKLERGGRRTRALHRQRRSEPAALARREGWAM